MCTPRVVYVHCIRVTGSYVKGYVLVFFPRVRFSRNSPPHHRAEIFSRRSIAAVRECSARYDFFFFLHNTRPKTRHFVAYPRRARPFRPQGFGGSAPAGGLIRIITRGVETITPFYIVFIFFYYIIISTRAPGYVERRRHTHEIVEN